MMKNFTREITVGGQPATLHAYYRRRKTLCLRVLDARNIRVFLPLAAPPEEAERMVREKSAWVIKRMKEHERLHEQPPIRLSEANAAARAFAGEVDAIVREIAPRMGVSPSYVALKEQKSIWGSCTGKNGVNLNWRLSLCRPDVAHYVVVHELAHLIEHNHSPAFWALVNAYVPNYKEMRKWLREEGGAILRRRVQED